MDNQLVLNSKDIILGLDNLNQRFSGKKVLLTGAAGFLGCQFMHYFYYMSKIQPDKPLLYPFDYKDIGDIQENINETCVVSFTIGVCVSDNKTYSIEPCTEGDIFKDWQEVQFDCVTP